MSVVQSRKLLNIISLMGIAVTISLSIYFYRLGVFDDMNSLQQLVGQSPIAGPLIFVLIQIIQVVIPIIPGGINHWLDDPRFDKLFTLAILFPVAPDDALCLMASLTNMSFKKYSAIIFLAKPASIFLYSLALLQGGALLEKLLLH